jgi:peptidoglycan/xylan/chitin deacetylase (PgdA/CDA1 family)
MQMRPRILRVGFLGALYAIRALGGFALASFLTRRRLRILCYHGFSVGDEYRHLPLMFMRAETFERRLRILKRRSTDVISLSEAITRLRAGGIDHCETVITLDDGWASNLTIGLPLLRKYGYPACIYATTEHLTAGVQAFNLGLYCMLTSTHRDKLTLSGINAELDGVYEIGQDKWSLVARLVSAAERTLPIAERQHLLRRVAGALNLDFSQVFKDGRLSFLSSSQLREVASAGIDIQLHTHTHRLPGDDYEAMRTEISQNQQALRDLTGIEARHFCYPSGDYQPVHPPWLERMGILSAVTCDPGLNGASTPPLLLKRYLDSELTEDIVFEAEICGFRDLLRSFRPSERRGAVRDSA